MKVKLEVDGVTVYEKDFVSSTGDTPPIVVTPPQPPVIPTGTYAVIASKAIKVNQPQGWGGGGYFCEGFNSYEGKMTINPNSTYWFYFKPDDWAGPRTAVSFHYVDYVHQGYLGSVGATLYILDNKFELATGFTRPRSNPFVMTGLSANNALTYNFISHRQGLQYLIKLTSENVSAPIPGFRIWGN